MHTGDKPLRSLWDRVSGRTADFDAEELIARHQVLERSFSAQCEALVRHYTRSLGAISERGIFPGPHSVACCRKSLCTFRSIAFTPRRSCIGIGSRVSLPGDRARQDHVSSSDVWLVRVRANGCRGGHQARSRDASGHRAHELSAVIGAIVRQSRWKTRRSTAMAD